MEVLRATSAMPYVSRPVELDGRFYLDGGVSDSIPVHFCKSLGYDKTVLVLTRPLEYRKRAARSMASAIQPPLLPSLSGLCGV